MSAAREPRGRGRDIAALVAWLAVSFAAAGLGSIASLDAPEFYAELVLPTWAPPASVFGPVWTVLYALQGVAAWLVWRAADDGVARGALLLFVVQLGANALWSWLFFAWREGALAFVEILVLWALIAATAAAFARVSRLAAALLLPYLLWVTFAAGLNYVLWQENPALLG